MSEQIKLPENLVFGLDIGTRSIVGTVGYREQEDFHVVAQSMRGHKTRAMIDGQIHDITKVAETITQVKAELEQQIQRPLTDVCIAAAGRVLRTVTVTVEMELPEETVITQENIYSLDLLGMEKAQEELHEKNELDIQFYCVGYSVIHYYLNGYVIGNLEGHKAKKISAEMIATFLPEEVVDGLYAAVELAGLQVANLTLEPIAAIQIAIPEKFRMLNIALVDVGAGTSDICITKDGSITAYGMIPMAGDELTEIIARQYLVDFDTAEAIKTSVLECIEEQKKTCDVSMDHPQGMEVGDVRSTITYQDIMGISHELDPQEVCDLLDDTLEEMTQKVADKIIDLNGDKPVSAVFVVGGGGKLPGYTRKLADKIGILPERVALRGEEVMGQVRFYQSDIKKDSILVTPIGICLNSYDKKNNFIFVNFNKERIKLFNNNKLTVVDAAMQAGFPNEGLFPKRGSALEFFVNGKPRIVRGEIGEVALVTVNGNPAGINTPIDANDKIYITPSTAGQAAEQSIGDLPEFHDDIQVWVNGRKVVCPKFVQVNGALVSGFYNIKQQDSITILHYYTLKQLLEFMDVILPIGIAIYINNRKAELDDKIYDNFTVDWGLDEKDSVDKQDQEIKEESDDTWKALPEEDDEYADSGGEKDFVQTYGEDMVDDNGMVYEDKEKGREGIPAEGMEMTVMVNQQPVILRNKPIYIFVDIFDYIDFDLSMPKGSMVVTKLNGREAQYTQVLKPNDMIEIYWED